MQSNSFLKYDDGYTMKTTFNRVSNNFIHSNDAFGTNNALARGPISGGSKYKCFKNEVYGFKNDWDCTQR